MTQGATLTLTLKLNPNPNPNPKPNPKPNPNPNPSSDGNPLGGPALPQCSGIYMLRVGLGVGSGLD